jgi:uncharacterized iron-regulated membrane protein
MLKLMLAFVLVCFAIQLLAMMGHLIWGLHLAPRGHGQAANDVKPGAGEGTLSNHSGHNNR